MGSAIGRVRRLAAGVIGLAGVFVGPALGHPGRGVVATREGTVYFADAGRSVVWACSPEGTLTAAGPGVHAHWLAPDPSGTGVYADHLRYEPAGERFLWGLVRITPGAERNEHRVEDVIAPAEGERGLGSGYFLVEAGDRLVRVATGKAAKVTRGRIGPPSGEGSGGDRVIATVEAERGVGGLCAGDAGELIISAGDRVFVVDAAGAVRVLVDRAAIDRALPPDAERREPLYGDELAGVCVLKDGSVLVCDPTNRRVVKVSREGGVSLVRRSDGVWAPVGVTVRGEEVLVLEAGFAAPARNVGPRVVARAGDGTERVLCEVPEREPSRPYR